MPIQSPITRQSAGKTFTVALAVLGVGALAQTGAVGWAFIARFHGPERPVPKELPMFARLTSPVGMRPDFTADPFSTMMEDVPPPGTSELSPGGAPPRPVPVPTVPTRPGVEVPQTRFDELIQQGKYLLERGDTANALTKFREAAAIDGKSPMAIAEIAATYEAMRLPDKAGEQWKRIYEMGGTAGLYFSLAEAKLKETQAVLRLEAIGGTSGASGTSGGGGVPVAESAPVGQVVELGKLRIEDRNDAGSLKRFKLIIPITTRNRARIEVPDLAIHVLFYDRLDGKSIVQTSANVSSKWVTAPADWLDSSTEELAVEYQLPPADAQRAKRELREFHGYIVRVYYKRHLQGAVAEPEQLGQDYPAPTVLPKASEP
ncbi:MAG: hypothetical protein K8R23_14135 [Chthoniobacter sp.]|nr:hypothetical protein [Chthoniobacter sp.]